MNMLTIIGTVQTESIYKKKDKNGNEFVYFVVIVQSEVIQNHQYQYRCIAHPVLAQHIKGNDKVCVNGVFVLRIAQKDDKPVVDFDIHVRQLIRLDEE